METSTASKGLQDGPGPALLSGPLRKYKNMLSGFRTIYGRICSEENDEAFYLVIGPNEKEVNDFIDNPSRSQKSSSNGQILRKISLADAKISLPSTSTADMQSLVDEELGNSPSSQGSQSPSPKKSKTFFGGSHVETGGREGRYFKNALCDFIVYYKDKRNRKRAYLRASSKQERDRWVRMLT
jgi:hypothetical protein